LPAQKVFRPAGEGGETKKNNFISTSTHTSKEREAQYLPAVKNPCNPEIHAMISVLIAFSHNSTHQPHAQHLEFLKKSSVIIRLRHEGRGAPDKYISQIRLFISFKY
jgi:hypothetical protein